MRGLRRPHCRRSGGADLDYDGFPLRNMDSIFDECGDSPFCAVADTMTPINPKYRGQYFNGGVLVLRPNATMYAHLLREAEADASAKRARWYAEQGFLNTHFRASAKRLPGGYNVMGASLDRGLPQKRWKRVRLERDFFVHEKYYKLSLLQRRLMGLEAEDLPAVDSRGEPLPTPSEKARTRGEAST